MHGLTIACVSIWVAAELTTTKQIPERLVYRGKKYNLRHLPLKSHLKGRRIDLPITSTACYRGYIGTWTIRNRTLYLTRLVRQRWPDDPGRSITYENIVPLAFKNKKRGPIVADWYTGVFRLPEIDNPLKASPFFRGPKVRYVTIRNGQVKAERVIDNAGAGALRSSEDLTWVALGDWPPQDDGKWIDGRLIPSRILDHARESGKPFTTRGILNTRRRTNLHLWIPPTPRTRGVPLTIASLPKGHDARSGSHVEVVARLVKRDAGEALTIDSIRVLMPGETIHHRQFNPALLPHP